jgi:hypothetical protein
MRRGESGRRRPFHRDEQHCHDHAAVPLHATIVAPFVAEGEPIPVRTGAIAAALFGPLKKAATIFTVSREVARQPGAEADFRRILQEDAALTLDTALFSDAAADDTRPGALLYGVSAVAVGYGGGDELALREDMLVLTDAVADGACSGALAFVMHPKRATRLKLLAPFFPWPMWPSQAVAEDRVIALDPTAFASGFGDGVDIQATSAATIHMSSTPAEIVSATGPTAADPVRSLFQTDSVAVQDRFALNTDHPTARAIISLANVLQEKI